MHRCAGGQVSTLHCREISAELTFRNKVTLARTLRTECRAPAAAALAEAAQRRIGGHERNGAPPL
jgi:hypothetical protein